MTAMNKMIAIAGWLLCVTSHQIAAASEEFDAERNDLSICSANSPLPKPKAKIDLKDFSDALRGTWVLRKRTIQGVVIETDSKYYFDLEQPSENAVKGWGMMLDLGNLSSLDPLRMCPACLADASVGALWKVSILHDPAGPSIHLKMEGDYLGSYGDFRKGVTATEETRFYGYGPAYLAGKLSSPAGGQGVSDDTWDRISLANGVLTYTSCKGGFIDRFVKVSDKKPFVKGLELSEAWPGIKQSGVLLKPPRGDYGN
jgi:hypothetical protein